MNIQELKNKLLNTTYFEDNIWLLKYITLIANSFLQDKQENYTEKHHIIPVSIYKYLYKCKTRYEAELIANKNTTTVNLSFIDHCKAHLYLYNCTVGPIKYSNEIAFSTMIKDKTKLQQYSQDELKGLLDWESIIKEKSEWYWSKNDLNFIKANYTKLTYKEIAKKLNRSEKMVQAQAQKLGILKTKQWTEEEHAWLVENRSKYSLLEISKILNRTVSSLKHYCLRNNIQAIPNWTKEEDNWLKENFTKYTYAKCAEYLNKSEVAVCQHCIKLKLSKKVKKNN